MKKARKSTSIWFVVTLLSVSVAAAQRPPRTQPPPPERPEREGQILRGDAETPLIRLVPSDYADGVSDPSGADRPNPRTVSNIVMAEPGPIPNQKSASSFLWQWGQFLDHDIDLTHTTDNEPFPISIPIGDPLFDPDQTGQVSLFFLRSLYDPASGTDPSNPRQQINSITAWIDASNVYGSDAERTSALRANDGTGRLAVSEGDLLPLNVDVFPDSAGARPSFAAGDVRAAEQVGLTSMHIVFLREHNRLADLIRANDPSLPGDEIFRRARRIVRAEMQSITYREFLPLLLGPGALKPYDGFRRSVDPSIANIFATAAYRLGHSMLNETLLRIGPDGRTVPQGDLPLASAFFISPGRFRSEGGVEPILRGLFRQQARRIDPYLTDAVRNFLFGAPGRGGFDLAALNIQRGRDHGLPDYNSARKFLGLSPKNSFASISSDPDVQRKLEEAYGSVDQIDPWVGGLAEDARHGALVGEFFYTILVDQFTRLRDGDRGWYQSSLRPETVAAVERTTLGDIIRLNTEIGDELPRDVFRAPPGADF